MKKISALLFSCGLLLALYSGCSKSDDAPPPPAPNPFPNTIWTGEYQEPNKPPFPYSLEFMSAEDVEFRSANNVYSGTYQLNDQTIVLSLRNNTIRMHAKVVNGEQLTQFENETTHDWKVLGGALNKFSLLDLENSTWLGNYTPGGTFGDYKLELKPDHKAIKLFKGNVQNGLYLREAGATHLLWKNPGNDYREFCVRMSENIIKGVLISDNNWDTFQLTKQ
jgi:hypothetical protein